MNDDLIKIFFFLPSVVPFLRYLSLLAAAAQCGHPKKRSQRTTIMIHMHMTVQVQAEILLQPITEQLLLFRPPNVAAFMLEVCV
jgi:hypothetical protein